MGHFASRWIQDLQKLSTIVSASTLITLKCSDAHWQAILGGLEGRCDNYPNSVPIFTRDLWVIQSLSDLHSMFIPLFYLTFASTASALFFQKMEPPKFRPKSLTDFLLLWKNLGWIARKETETRRNTIMNSI